MMNNRQLNIFLLVAATATTALAAVDEGIYDPFVIPASYEPGRLDIFDLDLHLSHGMTAKVIARAGERVQFADGSSSITPFHTLPDGAAVFEDTRPENLGGWVYVSNSEADNNQGGVGAVTFDKEGKVIDYKMLLTGTNRNCNGGKTDWNTWVTCEEPLDSSGKVYEVDPFGVRPPVLLPLGSQGGAWEAFAHDTRNNTDNHLYAFLTEDSDDGALHRMTIENPDYDNPHSILKQGGAVEYLVLEPLSFFERTSGTFRWTSDEKEGRDNAVLYYPNTEGMEMDDDGILCFVSKELDGFFHLDLDAGTYTFAKVGFAGQPDQSTTVHQDDGSKMVYFTEEAHPVLGILGQQVGVWVLDEDGKYTSIIFGEDYSSETTGIQFSPNGMHMYFAYQESGVLFDVQRADGLSFFARTAASTGWEETVDSSDDPTSSQGFFEFVEEGLDRLEDWFFN